MEGSYFPEDKDLAHKIMMDLSNTDLVKLCSANKRLHDVCNNYPDFWRNKFIKDYGEHATQYKPKNRSWKNHYMSVFIDLQRFKKNPIEFFLNIAWKNNIDDSFFVDYSNERKTPLTEAPDWVMNNLYLLNLPNVRIGNEYTGKIIEYKNAKPIEILQQQSQDRFYYIHGFTRTPNFLYIPQYSLMSEIKFRF